MPAEKENTLDAAFTKSLQLAFPPVMVQLLQALLEPAPSFASISTYLSMDPMLASTVLHIANSASYSFREKVTDIQRAAIAIGTDELFRLIVSLALQKKLHPAVGKRSEASLFGDWRLTLWSAIAAEAMARYLCPNQRQQAYLAGILKDLPLFLAFCGEEVPPFLDKTPLATISSPRQLAEELSYWGHTHPELAYDIFLYWGFPEAVAVAVRNHHDLNKVTTHTPLSQCIIYATYWAELLHEPDKDPSRLVAFELSLANELGMQEIEMERFRADCAERFNLVTAQLGIQQASPETRMHDQSLSTLQNYHFLATELFSSGNAISLPEFAATLQRQLRIFWGVTTWELYLCPPGIETGSMFRCSAGSLLPEECMPMEEAKAARGWQTIHLASHNKQFGFLALPKHLAQKEDLSSLPLFMHVLGMRFEEQRKRLSITAEKQAGFADLPLAIAIVDSGCRIKDTTKYFLDIFGLSSVPTNVTAKSLLDARLGISLPKWEEMLEGKTPVHSWITSAPEGSSTGTLTYISLHAVSDNPDEFYLTLGDLTSVNQLQAVALAHPNYLDALFNAIPEQVYLLDTSGTIFWSAPDDTMLSGKNLFAISKPDDSFSGSWNASFLSNMHKVTRVQAMIIAENTPKKFELIFSPLLAKNGQQILLTIKPAQRGQDNEAIPSRMVDSLTGLHTHSKFHLLLEQEAKKAARTNGTTGIIYCDIEKFHRINEMYGFQTGDAILQRTATCLDAACRTGLDHACRYGGEKFALIITGASEKIMTTIAMQAQQQIQTSCHGAITIAMGLILVRPGEAPLPRLGLAVQACRDAKKTEHHCHWAQ